MTTSKVNKYQGKRELDIAVSDYVLRNLTTGVETFIDTITEENLEKTSTSTKVKAGVNADVVYTINGDEEITLTFSDAFSRPELTNLKWNAQEKNGVIVKTCFPKNYIVSTGKTINLPQEPLVTADVILYKGETPLESLKYSISGKVITITDDSVNEGDSIFVSSFEYNSEASDYFEVGEGSSALSFEILRRKPIFNDNLEITKYKCQHFGKATMSAEASEQRTAERESQPTEYSFSIEKRQDLPYVFRTWYEDK